MARPQRKNVDYFPFYCKEGKGMFYIEQKYKNDGFATWIKIIRELAKAENHYLNLSEEIQIMYLAAKCNIDIDKLNNIINDLVKLGEFDAELWHENKVVFSVKFIESVQEAYAKRTNDCIDRNSLLLLLNSLGVRKPSKSTRKPSKSDSHSVGNTQSIEEYSIEEYSIEDIKPKKGFTPPTIFELKEYFKEKGYNEQTAQKMFDSYSVANWHDSKGNKIKNWKQKAINVWFKDENKEPEKLPIGKLKMVY